MVDARELLQVMARQAWHNGDPGIDYSTLREATRLLTRVLDNGVELNLDRYPNPESTTIAHLKRKIGISVCGLADLFLTCDLPYDSKEARKLARDVLAFINYTSKRASIDLAKERGACRAMQSPQQNQYLSGRWLEDKYAKQKTANVSQKEWLELAAEIRRTGLLRNITTTALPPSGRTSILMDASPSIEPILSLCRPDGSFHAAIVDFVARHAGKNNSQEILEQARTTGSFQASPLSDHARACLRTAQEIPYQGQIKMVADLAGMQGVVDESASKTIILPQGATVENIADVFTLAYRLRLKNISVYRQGSRADQPIRL